jgi:MFS family permease
MLVDIGWRETYFFIGILSTGLMFPLIFFLNRKPNESVSLASGGSEGSPHDLGLTPNKLTALLCVAGVSCCIAMAMPQVHLVALCGDRGYGSAVGAQMLSLMLACGLVSRLGFGWLSDRLGGLMTLLIGSSLQCLALVCFLGANSLVSVYAVSMMFGLFQGGIVPSYALVVREFFPEAQAASRLGIIILATVFGMAFGGWISGAIYDYTSSYQIAFAHGAGWNLVNVAIILMLLVRSGRLKSLAWNTA